MQRVPFLVLAFAAFAAGFFCHTSGEWIESRALLPLAKLDPQGPSRPPAPTCDIPPAICAGAPTLAQADWQAFFSPNGGAQAAIVAALDGAQREVRVLAYSFTSRPIADAILRAKRRGVDVRVVQDGPSTRGRGAIIRDLAAAGIECTADRAHAIQHNKVIILDRQSVITGSFNFSANAETANAENLLRLDSPALADVYLLDWRRHRAHATPL